jgi:hypothetical protein
VREEKGELRKELEAPREEMRGREEKWQAEEAVDEKDENYRGKNATKKKEGEKE